MTKKKQLIIAGVIAVVFALAGVLTWVQIERSRDSKAAKEKAAYEKIINDSQKLITNGKYDTAINAINTYLKKEPPKEYRQGGYAQLGAAYASQGKYDEARKSYLKAQEIDGKPQLHIVLGIAYMSQALKDTDMAIEYFNNAIELTEKGGDPFAAEDIASYKAMVKQLQDSKGTAQ